LTISIRQRVLSVIVVAAATLFAPATAAHATPSGSSSAHPRVVTFPGAAASKGSVSTAAACPITVYGYTGQRVCGYGYSYIDRGNGNVEWFVIGTNYAVYHIWPSSGGWKSLGGQSSRNDTWGAIAYLNPEGVSTVGTNELLYCRDWPWTRGWERC
jgi:hypothetical protein